MKRSDSKGSIKVKKTRRTAPDINGMAVEYRSEITKLKNYRNSLLQACADYEKDIEYLHARMSKLEEERLEYFSQEAGSAIQIGKLEIELFHEREAKKNLQKQSDLLLKAISACKCGAVAAEPEPCGDTDDEKACWGDHTGAAPKSTSPGRWRHPFSKLKEKLSPNFNRDDKRRRSLDPPKTSKKKEIKRRNSATLET